MNRRLSNAFRRDLLKLSVAPSWQLDALLPHWPQLEKRIKAKRRQLAANIPADDPIRFPVDLLTPLGCIADETLHTRALAYLLNVEDGHGFGKHVLASVLEKVRNVAHSKESSKVLALMHHAQAQISVTPEYRYCVEGFRNRSVARCDIWITVQSKKGNALIIIENKIASLEGKGQLGWYQRKANEWCRKNGGLALLIYLAVERTPKEKWLSLSYLDLASALREAWRKNPNAIGRGWLGLYIASIARGVLKADVQNRPQVDAMKAYLGKI